jgi:adenine deaminase
MSARRDRSPPLALPSARLPGLIDAHVHFGSSKLTPAEFARAVVPRGTTAVVCDSHEIANVL